MTVAASNYATAWRFSEPILLVLLALAVREIHGELTRGIRRLGAAGSIVIASGVLAGVGVAAAATPPGLGFPAEFRAALQGKAISTTIMAGTLLAPWLFFRRFPIPLSPRLIWHARIMALYLICFALVYFRMGWATHRSQLEWANTAMMAAWAILLLAWLWAFRLPATAPASRPTNAGANAATFEHDIARLSQRAE